MRRATRALAAVAVLAIAGACTSGQPESPSATKSPGGGCIPEYADFMRLGGITYVGQGPRQVGRPITEADLGPVVGKVKRTLSESFPVCTKYTENDGDAGFVEVGEPIFTLKGYDRRFRLATRSFRELRVYVVGTNPAAKRAGDLLDLEGKVTRIQVNDVNDWVRQLGEITDPAEVDRLVSLVLAAPLDPTLQRNGSEQPVYTIAFWFRDGTAMSRSYWVTRGDLWQGIALPDEFRTAIQAALKRPPP